MEISVINPFVSNPLHEKSKTHDRIFQVRYLQSLNLVTVRGWSLTKEIHQKYSQLIINIDQHLDRSNCLNIHFKYELFNSSSLKYIFQIIKKMNEAHAAGKLVKIFWSCTSVNESEMIEMGLDLMDMCDFKFQISYL